MVHTFFASTVREFREARRVLVDEEYPTSDIAFGAHRGAPHEILDDLELEGTR
jgi:hypothetical protein